MSRKLEVLSDSDTSEDDEQIPLPSKKIKTGLDLESAAASSNKAYAREDEEGLAVNKVGRKQNKASSQRQNIKDKTNKELKKVKNDQEKQLAKDIKQVLKSTNKEECMQNIIVIINNNILEQEYGDAIKNILRDNKISVKTTDKFFNSITWNQKLQTIEDMRIKEWEATGKHAFVVLSAKKFSDLVADKRLINHIKERIAEMHCEHITIAIYGIYKPTETQERAILELEMHIKCHIQFCKTVDSLANFILMLTKAVALIPYKTSNEEKYKSQNLYLNEFKKDTVRVDQNGNGLGRLWHQMLTMFPLARLETAEAITAAYPTPAALFKSYESSHDKETMLQHIDVRRAHGPLTANRRIGPEMSRRVCNFFTASVNKTL